VGGHATTGSATRRRRLALLALLAVARDRGLNRDKVQTYLLAESDTERARHGLNQLVYFQRRHLDSEDLFLGKKTLRLNRAVITTDMWDFEDALDAGAPEVAVQAPGGTLCPGVRPARGGCCDQAPGGGVVAPRRRVEALRYGHRAAPGQGVRGDR